MTRSRPQARANALGPSDDGIEDDHLQRAAAIAQLAIIYFPVSGTTGKLAQALERGAAARHSGSVNDALPLRARHRASPRLHRASTIIEGDDVIGVFIAQRAKRLS